MHKAVSVISKAFEQRGSEKYGIEAVTQLEHAKQCACLAREHGASDTLIVAALLHDIGHILGSQPLPGAIEEDYDDHHEEVGYRFLVSNFGESVAEPVRLHVAAKRYLCTTDSSYLEQLSPTSVKSFHDQGGVMNQQELDDFRSSPYFEESLELRRWDDLAKSEDPSESDLGDFMPHLERTLLHSV